MHSQFPCLFSDKGGEPLGKHQSGSNQKSATVRVEWYDLKNAALNNQGKYRALDSLLAQVRR